MKIEVPKNPNYCATVVSLKDFVDLPNCDNVKAALIFGNSVIVSKKQQVGDLGLFFPAETALSPEFMSNNNLYRHAEWGNVDPEKTGFFDQHGRVKAVRFRGHKSEGFWIPINSLEYLPFMWKLVEGDTFDRLEDKEICRKYIAKGNPQGLSRNKGKKGLEESIVDGQFRFHFDTENLRKNMHKINPTDVVSISDKWHGTSIVIGKILVKRELPWYERALRKLGVRIQEQEYGHTHSSRRVIKGVGDKELSKGLDYYGDDVWGVVANEVSDKIPASYTLYGEVVGYTPSGKAIQAASGSRHYHYGCQQGKHKLLVYRVVTTNADGKTLELSWPQMQEFTKKYGLEMVHTFYYGPISNLFSPDPYFKAVESFQTGIAVYDVEAWRKDLLVFLEKTYVRDEMCQFNNGEVPAEGVVVRIDGLTECQSYKLKNFLFLEDESKKNDKGEVDIETVESTTEDEA